MTAVDELANKWITLTRFARGLSARRYTIGKMKHDKSKYELEGLERDFRRKLLPRLKAAAEGKQSLLFCISQLNQFQEVCPPAESDQLFVGSRVGSGQAKYVIWQGVLHNLASEIGL